MSHKCEYAWIHKSFKSDQPSKGHCKPLQRSAKYNRRDRDVFDISDETPLSIEEVRKVHKSSAQDEDGYSYGWTAPSIKQ